MTSDLVFTVTTDHVTSSGAVQSPEVATRAAAAPSFTSYLRDRSAGFGTQTNSKISVNEQSAMSYAAVYASIRVISESKASLPIKLYEVDPVTGSETETKTHPVAELLSVEPNPDQTPMVYHEWQQSQVLSRGNSFAEIHYDRSGNATELEPIHPTNIEIGRDTLSGRLLYQVTDQNGETRVLDQSQMLHVPGLGGDGISGWSPIRLAAESIGIGLANERFAGKYFGDFARPSVIVESEQELGPDRYDQLQNALQNNYSGDNVGGALLLEGGLKGKTVSIPLNECQFLESRQYQGKEIACRWYRIPAQIAGYTDDGKYDHVEQADLFFAKHTLGPWVVRDEQEYRRKLFRKGERRKWKIKHNMDALQRASIQTRYEAHQSAIVSGWKTRNEVRQLEDLNPLEGGDNLILPASVFGNQPESTPTGPAADDGDDTRSNDPRLGIMVRQAVDGLMSREAEAHKRSHDKPDATTRLDTFFDKQRDLIATRFKGVTSEAGLTEILAIIELRRTSAKATQGGLALEARNQDAERITDLILEKSTVQNE